MPISNNPIYPKIGYNKFNRLPKPKLQQQIDVIHKIIEKIKYCLLFLEVLFKKLYPAEIAVVKIADKITKPYIYL